jgi:hypothetical protein
MEAREALMKLRRLFTSGHWTRGRMHRKTLNGEDRYCLVGGLRHVLGYDPDFGPANNQNLPVYREAIRVFKAANGGRDPVEYNDSRFSPEHVIEGIDRAVAVIDQEAK